MFHWVTHWFSRSPATGAPPHYCEADYSVSVDDKLVQCRDPQGGLHSILWASLKSVAIETTDKGPWQADIFWVLSDEKLNYSCKIPLGATGESGLADRLQSLPNFNDEVFIEALESTRARRFVCWQAKMS